MARSAPRLALVAAVSAVAIARADDFATVQQHILEFLCYPPAGTTASAPA
jgi:chondroitin AC lyase